MIKIRILLELQNEDKAFATESTIKLNCCFKKKYNAKYIEKSLSRRDGRHYTRENRNAEHSVIPLQNRAKKKLLLTATHQ